MPPDLILSWSPWYLSRCTGVFGTLSRFCQKLYSQCPITPSELDIGGANSTDQPNTAQSNSRGDCPHLSFPAPPPPGSTKQEFRRWRKRLVKLRNRQQRFLDSSSVPAENQEKGSMLSETNAVLTGMCCFYTSTDFADIL